MRLLALCVLAHLASAPDVVAQMATAERVESAAWWPTKPVPRDGYAGPQSCAACHPKQAGTQTTTSMARTGQRAADAAVLRRGDLTFRAGKYTYRLSPANDVIYSVTDGEATQLAPLGWAFGAGKVGQSFLFERDGQLHEARVSYYDAIGGLDFTPNRALAEPRSVDEAMSRPIPHAEVRRCFACHTTASAKPPADVDFARLIPGVTCEACHGPGGAHVAAMARGRRAEGLAAITNPRTLAPADSVDFCGACHATFWDVKLADERGIAALRSQPYRLQSSRCGAKPDARITCVACHDPHQPLVRETASYDGRCLACHATGETPAAPSHVGRGCKVGAENCAGCHMPRYEVPGMHFAFTDHLIRVVR